MSLNLRKLFGNGTHNKLLVLSRADMIEESRTANIKMISYCINLCEMLFRSLATA